MIDLISRHGTSAWLENMGHPNLAKMIMDEKRFPSAQSEIIYCKDCSKHNVTISKAPYPFKEYICPLIAFRGEAKGHEFDYQFCVYAKRREVTKCNS